jgi:hypothetical protein
MGGILMAGVGGLMAYSKAGGKFGRGVQAGGGQTTGGSYGYTPSEGLYEPDYVYPSQEWTSDMPSGVDVSGANSWGSTRYRSARQRRGY